MKVLLPLRVENTSNKREHWAQRWKRTAPQRRAAALKVKPQLHQLGGTRLVVLLTRIAPRELDDDNLRSALKSCRDGVATALRVDDSTPLVRWDYAQRRGEPHEYAVEVMINWEVPA